jgi:hypothetical protein
MRSVVEERACAPNLRRRFRPASCESSFRRDAEIHARDERAPRIETVAQELEFGTGCWLLFLVGNFLRFILAKSFSCSSLIDRAICREAPLSVARERSPRFAARPLQQPSVVSSISRAYLDFGRNRPPSREIALSQRSSSS